MIKNKTVLIIGAKSDIAIAVAYKFASEGWNLQLTARNSAELEVIVNDIKIRHEIKVSVYEFDILNFDTFDMTINSLDCLPQTVICTVGLLGNQANDEKNLLNSTLIMKTNYLGPSLFLGQIANHFENRGFGSIIGISSVAGDRGRSSNYIYGSAKSGFTSFLAGLRNRLFKSNVNVLTVVPGFVNTKMIKKIKTPMIITNSPEHIGRMIFKNRFRSKVIYPFPWRIILFIIKIIPERIFIRLKL